MAADGKKKPLLAGKIKPSIKDIAILLLVYLGVGTICFYLLRNQMTGTKTNEVLDSIYFCIVTMTTVGYGDLVPNSVPAKLLTCVLVFSGIALVCVTLTKASDYLLEKHEMVLLRSLHMRGKVGPSEILKEAETSNVTYKSLVAMIILVLLIVAGTVFLATVEKLDIVDAFYCVCSTITTLGYGDASFSTVAGRIFAIFWILTSTFSLAQLILYIIEENFRSRRLALVKLVLTKKMTYVDLELADMDDDGAVSAAAFVIFKLKEMGKIRQEDISLVMDEFENLDIDQ